MATTRYYEICLTATVNQTLTDTQCVNIFPQTTVVTLATDPVGLLVNYEDEGLTQPSPLIVASGGGLPGHGVRRAHPGRPDLLEWSDGQTSNAHDFLVGTTAATFTAQYVNQPPLAVASVSPLGGVAPLAVQFTGSGSSDPEFTTLTYSWDFGDGGNSTQANPTHSYTSPGTYTATLTVTDQRNGTATKSLTLIVTATGQCGNGQIDPGEACDGGPCCTGGCQFAGAGAVCRPATGLCDVAETCTGSSATCPADVLAASGTLCRPAAGVCDVAETCTGSSPACPTDVLVAAGTTCRPPASPCDVAEACTGSSTACPADLKAANGTSCSDGNACNGVETCQGGACSAGTPLACNDGNPCTDDSCDAATGCVFLNNTAPCSDDVACTNDLCTNGVCVSTSSCPVGQTCNSTTGACEVPAGGYTLWPTNPIPAIADGGDTNAVQLGVKFRSDVAGFVTGMRFYKTTTNTGTHVGTLWSSAGAPLATGTFTNESPSGWQQLNFATPVAIAANSVYLVSYFAPNGHYSGNLGYFAQALDAPPLHALADGAQGGNGVFGYGTATTFPTGTFQSLNYWVDVVFTPQATATLTSIAVTPANPSIAQGGTQQFTATGTYSDSSLQNLTSQVTWTSSTTSVATITAAGLATGITTGTSTVSAALGELGDSTTLTVLPPGGLAITTTSVPVGILGKAYSATLAATGGTPPYTWSIASGTLPAGLTLGASTGVISGTPTAIGVSSVTFKVVAGALNATRVLGVSVAKNQVAAENALPGNPASQWDVTGAGDASIQGFATDISVNQGDTISFKVNTPSTNYRLDIYRLGYYGGLGARQVATVQPSATLPQTPAARACPTSATGLVDCGNWAVSASWSVPATATSGIYIAKLVRRGSGGRPREPHRLRRARRRRAPPTCSSRPPTPPGRPTTPTAATASTSARPPAAPTR